MKNRKFKQTTGTLATLVFATLISPITFAHSSVVTNKSQPSPIKTKRSSYFQNENAAMRSILNSTTGLSPHVLRLGLNSYEWAAQHANVRKRYLTIVNFSIPSKYKRLWIINLNTDKVVMKGLVANGKNSGLYVGHRFSNRFSSLESSLGVYLTGVRYYGNDGLSLHVHGLQPGINNNAYRRTVEIHGANYVSPWFAEKYGRVGRSYGCFALNKAVLSNAIRTIKNGSVLFAYANGHNADYSPYANN